MSKRLLVIGGVAAGPKAAAKARRCDPGMEILIIDSITSLTIPDRVKLTSP